MVSKKRFSNQKNMFLFKAASKASFFAIMVAFFLGGLAMFGAFGIIDLSLQGENITTSISTDERRTVFPLQESVESNQAESSVESKTKVVIPADSRETEASAVSVPETNRSTVGSENVTSGEGVSPSGRSTPGTGPAEKMMLLYAIALGGLGAMSYIFLQYGLLPAGTRK
jgi:hypothetical protein